MMQGLSFPPHPAGMQPGMPHGHPGMPPNAQHMGQPMQMPGVSGPGGPHMGQTAMMGMQPGQQNMPGGMGPGPGGGMQMPQQTMGGPGANAMAMSHLTPQAHMLQQQQQHHQMQQAMAANPQLALQQQHMARQRQLMQQQQQQQQQMNGMGMAMGMNGHPGMNPQQFAQLQAGGAFQNAAMAGLPPQHMLQIQQMRQMQAAQQQQQQQQPPHPQGPQAPATPQQQQAMAQHMAMQHASSQASHQSAPPNSQAPPQQPPSAQMRAQSQIPSGPEGQGQPPHSQPPQPQPPQGPQAQPQQPPQPPSAHPTPQVQPQQLPQQTPVSQPQQPNQQPQQPSNPAQPPNQPQNAQQQQQAQQQAQQQQLQQAQQQQQRQQAQQNAINMNMMRQQQAMAAQQGRGVNGQFILKLIQFSDHLSAFNANSRESNNLEHWHAFVNQFFSPDGRLIQHILDNGNSSKQFTINASSLARYYWTYFDSGVQNIQLQLEGVREVPSPNNGHWVSCNRARYIFWFANNTQLIWQGKLTATFPPGSDKFEMLEFEVTKTDEYIPRSELARVIAQGSPLMNKSPKMSRTPAKKAAMQKAQGALQLEDFPSAPVNEYAITPAVMQYLEVAETIFFMKDLMEFSQKNELRPHDALNQMVAQMEEQQQQQQGMPQQPGFNQPQNMMPTPMQPNHAQMALQRNGIVQPLPQGAGTPNQAHMQLPGQPPNFSSPSVPHMNLPMQQHLNGQQMIPMNGSPHIAHPGLPGGNLMAPNHMQMAQMQHSPSPHMGPPMMVPQHSQQGNNPNSAQQPTSTSPNLSSKRRRSHVKLEADDLQDGPPAQRLKPSPGMGPKKK